MATSSSNTLPTTAPTPAEARVPLRLRLDDTDSAGGVGGAWWPQSRDLQTESADLVDHFPEAAGRINRILFSRPDWDSPAEGGRGVRRIQAGRGPVKTGSFPHDDTHLMVLSLASGRRLKLEVIPSATGDEDGQRLLGSA